MGGTVNRQWRLAARPVGMIKESDFRAHEEGVPEPGEGEYLVRTIYLSVDPTNRGWMEDRPSYMPPVGIGEVMRGYGVGEVVASDHPRFRPGDLASGMLGWQEYVVAGGRSGLSLQPLPPGTPLQTSLSVFSATGMSAYFGLLDLGRPRPGETVVVSGAAGAVGSVAGQIARIKGCRVVGIAGADEKCAWLTDELGFDAAINYRTEPVGRRLGETCPDGIDIYFDNVGGEILEAALWRINERARVVLCGGIAGYSATEPAPGPTNLMQLILKRARMEGFLIIDYQPRFAEAAAEMAGWMADGTLHSREQLTEGIESAPRALCMLFEGGNTGKLLVKVGPEPGEAG